MAAAELEALPAPGGPGPGEVDAAATWRQAKHPAARAAVVGMLAPGLLQEMASRWGA